MEVYVGTSGWAYPWNPDGFKWYASESGLNAVELNASFYRFPFPNQVVGWARASKPRGIRWSVKVHRSITHYRKLSEAALETWRKFSRLFEPLEEAGLLDFYLFQLPPSVAYTSEVRSRVEKFAEATELGWRFALEPRHPSWFENRFWEWCESIGVTAVSIDSPMGVYIYSTGGTVYLRMHGRSAWYAHWYSEAELAEDAARIAELKPRRAYVFFNNDHAMLENARAMKAILEELAKLMST